MTNRFKSYEWDILGNFFTENTIQVVPRHENLVADSLAVATRKFDTHVAGQREYRVEIVNDPLFLIILNIGRCSKMTCRSEGSWNS